MIFTTSWDDGYALDLRIAKILEKYGARGTFYICPQQQHGLHMLTSEEVLKLGQHHELGAHTIKHPRLSRIPLEQAREEILQSKRWIESCTGQECRMFCYPYGDFNAAVRQIVADAGFCGARTVEELQCTSTDRYALPTSLHLHPFPLRRTYTRWWHVADPLAPLRSRWKRLNELEIPISARTSWLRLAKALFRYAIEHHQPFFHLWGHAYELDRYGLWEQLEAFVMYVAEHAVPFRTNGELVTALYHST